MTKESMKKLLLAYRAVCATQMTSVAELLEAVILDEMGGGTPWMVSGHLNAIDPPWKVEADPLFVPRSYTVNTTTECTSIDHLSKEAES